MEGAETLLNYSPRPPGWVVIESTESGLVLRDPDFSLLRVIVTSWKLLLTAALDAGLVAFTIFVAPPLWFFYVIGLIALVGFVFCFLCMWLRWRTPCLVRIGNGRMFLQTRQGSKLSEYDWDVRDITNIETSFNNPTFHSNYAFRVHLRDGGKFPFLHCFNGREGHWLLNYLKMLIAEEQGALMVREGLVAALEISLPPPPLPAMAARVTAIEEQVVGTVPAEALKTAPPGPLNSQSASISSQNRA
jgi:hypothetical protein